MVQVTAVPKTFGLQGRSCRWCLQKGFSKKSLAKGVWGKRLCQRDLLERVFQKDFARNILQRGWVSFAGIEVPRPWAMIQGEHPLMQTAGIKTISSQIKDTRSLLKHFPAWGLAASSGCGSPGKSPLSHAPCGRGDLGVL